MMPGLIGESLSSLELNRAVNRQHGAGEITGDGANRVG